MRGWAISDLHLGDGSPADDFTQDDWFVGFLSLHRNDFVVLVGDVFDLWQNELWEIEKAHPDVCDAIARWVDVVLDGNHHRGVKWFCGHDILPELTYKGWYFEHGSRFDFFNHGIGKPIGRTLAWGVGVAERLIHRDIDRWLTHGVYRMVGAGRYGETAKYRKAALQRLAEVPHASQICIGHTHKWAKMPPYYNSGCVIGNRRDAITFDIIA